MEFIEKEDGIYIQLEDSIIGYVKFERKGHTLDVVSTYVDPNFRNQHLAAKLMEKLIEYAMRENCYIHPICSYVVRYFEKNTKYQPFIV